MNEAPRELLRDAAEWRLIGLLFEYPAGEWRSQIETLATGITAPALAQAAAVALTQASPGMHHSLFGPGGPVPPREASYQTGVQLGYLLAELTSIYDAFGYKFPPAESPDHVAVETGFVAFLKFKLAYETTCGNGEQARMCEDGIRYMLDEHLRNLAEPIALQLESSGPPYLVLAAQALLERVGPGQELPAFALPGLDSGDADAELTCGIAPPVEDPLIQLHPQGDAHGR